MPTASYLIIFLLFLLQFIYFPIGISHFETPKVYTAEISIFILFIISLFSRNSLHWKVLKKSTTICLIVLFLLTVIDLIFLRTTTTFFGNTFRLQGIFLFWMLVVFALLSANIAITEHLNKWILLSILVLQLFFTLILGGQGSRAVGTIGEPNALAANIVFIWPFIYFSSKQKTIWKIVSISIALMVIILSESRSGIIAFGIQLIFILFSSYFHISIKKFIVFCLLLLLSSYILPFFDHNGPYENRSEVWQNALLSGFSQPFIGNGFGNTQYALQSSVKKFPNNLGTSVIDSSHNIFLDWFVQGGIIGLGSFIFLLFQSFLMFINKKEVRNIVLLIGLLTCLSFNPASIVSLIALWWLIGKGMKVYVVHDESIVSIKKKKK